LRARAQSLSRKTYALYLAARDPRVPWPAKLLIAAVVGYALSPIDLIPDFVPVVGYLDDVLVLPLGVWLALRMIPPEVWRECEAAAARPAALPCSRRAAVLIVVIWVAAGTAVVWWGARVLAVPGGA
jgi:uncharacterized membrane protein YkvA (DUF1232 family)